MARTQSVTIGVSKMTVSRVLNDRPDVAPETRRRVRQVIEELGYRPSHAARSLSQGQSRSIGVVAFGIEYFGPSRAVSGIEKRAAELGYTPLLYLLRDPGSNDVDRILADLVSRHVDGVIWAVPQIGDNRAWLERQMPSLRVPLVFLSMEPRPDISTACVNNYQGARLATQHLIDCGYRNIGLITGPIDWWDATERIRGWRDTLTAAGLDADDDLIAYGNWSANSGKVGLEQLLRQRPDVEGVFASNDLMAMGAMQTARRRGLSIPDDLAIVGFDDMPEAECFWPPLTTIRQPLFDMGGAAVSELQRLIDAFRREDTPIRPESTLLDTELVVRESTAASQHDVIR
jgi:LacI family transcriptional regulator